MIRTPHLFLCTTLLGLFLIGCAAKPVIPVDYRSVNPGETVTRGGQTTHDLLGQPVDVGEQLPDVNLVDRNLRTVNLADLRGEVLLISIVPSVDTQVCEQQTHQLGELAIQSPAPFKRVSISRDLPFAQKRFAEETGFDEILFLSDYQQAEFGMSTGLLVDRIFLLARAVMVVDRDGTVRYLQVVPEISHLPDFERALTVAQSLAREHH